VFKVSVSREEEREKQKVESSKEDEEAAFSLIRNLQFTILDLL